MEVPEVKTREGISGLELPNPYEMVLQTAGGESVEIPWTSPGIIATQHTGQPSKP